MVTLVNFADSTFETNRRWNTISGKMIGGFGEVIEYGPKDLADEFLTANKSLFEHSKGFGNYCWKSYIINDALSKVKESEFLFYADSGSLFIKNITPLVEDLMNSGKDIMCFELPFMEKYYTKRDAFILLNCDEPHFYDSPQIMGGFILIRKSIKSCEFFKIFQEMSSDARLISDQPNMLGKENLPEFITHRHDQSILSLMAKKNQVLITGDLSDYGLFPRRFAHSGKFSTGKWKKTGAKYGNKVFLLSTRKVHPLLYLAKHIVRLIMYKMGIYHKEVAAVY